MIENGIYLHTQGILGDQLHTGNVGLGLWLGYDIGFICYQGLFEDNKSIER